MITDVMREEYYNRTGHMLEDKEIEKYFEGFAYKEPPRFPYGEKDIYRPKSYQVGGDHYSKHNIQPIDVIREYKMDFFEGNALKYLLRYKEKNGVQDLDKAIDYINMMKDNIKEISNV